MCRVAQVAFTSGVHEHARPTACAADQARPRVERSVVVHRPPARNVREERDPGFKRFHRTPSPSILRSEQNRPRSGTRIRGRHRTTDRTRCTVRSIANVPRNRDTLRGNGRKRRAHRPSMRAHSRKPNPFRRVFPGRSERKRTVRGATDEAARNERVDCRRPRRQVRFPRRRD